MSHNPFRDLPPVTAILELDAVRALGSTHGQEAVTGAVRLELETLRTRLKAGETLDGVLHPEQIAIRIGERLETTSRNLLRPVINATGIVLHTNLGRSPIAESAAKAAYDAARGYLNLELDLKTGKRSSRQDPIREVLCPLLGCESATVVNNCAAATVIVLRALAAGKEVIVSRGQLVEIGGSFRIPEIMGVSGATLREVGSTNITRIGDYEKAIGPNTALLMRVHHSNYRISGFTHTTSLEELVALGRKHKLPVIDDAGSGALFDFAKFGLPGDPVIGESLKTGADLVLFSGDKLLGGPQAGLIVGKKELVAKIERDPLMRAFRLDKMSLAALEATLRLYQNPERVIEQVPILKMLSLRPDQLRPRAESLAAKLRDLPGIEQVEVREDSAFVGGGSLPDLPLPTVVVTFSSSTFSEEELAQRLRDGTPAVLARVQEGRVLLDLRTVFETQDAELLAAIVGCIHPATA